VKLSGNFLPAALGVAVLAGCASSYQAPVIDRTVTRQPAAIVGTPPQRGADTYIVKRGDTLYSIALDNGLDYRELAAWNNIGDPSAISPGSVLRMRPLVPTTAGQKPGLQAAGPPATVQVQPVTVPGAVEARPLGVEPPAASGLPPSTGIAKTEPKAVNPPSSDQNLAMIPRSAPPITAPKPELPSPPAASADGPDSVAWIWPATGRVLAGFSEATNKGVDIVGKIGDPVLASASGRVVYSGTGLRGYGKLIIIKHNATYLSAYAHNSNLLVKEGQNVVRGQKIAEIGNTDSTQAMLHFEIRRLGKPVDPLKYLPDRSS
jgi:lipoprotein NlpD